MAGNEDTENILLAEIADSSDEEYMLIPSPVRPIVDDNDDDPDELQICNAIFGAVQRVEHTRIVNYVETIVQNYNNVDFIMHFRLSRHTTNRLIGDFTTCAIFTALQDDAGRPKISAEKHILCYLWFVGHESASYRDVADRFGITLSALYNIITRVTEFILSFANNVITYPNAAEKAEIAAFYENTKGFPNVIGAIDGSHIRIDKPSEDPDSYINRKQYFSIHIQGTVDHCMKFRDVFIGYPGSVHDARVFRNSSLRNDLQDLCGDTYYLLGDSAYPCLPQLMVPYRDNGHLTRVQRHFNMTLSACRVVIEHAFGCLKQRFRQLYHLKLRDLVRMVRVIHACCVLHNLASAADMEVFEPPILDDYPDMEAQHNNVCDNNVQQEQESGVHIRDDICHRIFTL